ncbi:monovalent cation:proton antiporter-2 (CPA2) family protein [Rubellimicrobium aerolatum]|uniref:Monovalent cation:proton antiporter-2 (CPA2) family protein n=1 Tax=Rubellimicrobium aerolatum TaxID=490979 RepID=A0ABW0SEA1_9RHOB|nr:monovalent cation:proton antiporter-2 (CPA2) family protein [Rubellimicrobium aerolatum]MBP1805658.1 glutathione-regulated potassium-efflux system protein KefB [Rubellimicrobium aerolatum]
MAEAAGPDLAAAVTLLGAAVVAVPLFRRWGLGSVLGYLAAGLAMGPFGLRVIGDPEAMLHVAELGVVLFLFIIGLEMEPRRLWSMRRDIFGLGLAQVLLCMALLAPVGVALGYPLATSLVAGTGFVLTSTAIVMQMLSERGDLSRARGQHVVSILLLEDLAIVPLLALVAFLAPGGAEPLTGGERALAIATGLGAIALLILAGWYLLNPLFRFLATFGGREVMTAGALLVVLGSALLLQAGGLSAAMGAFLAGVLLSESTFRHQLEADIEPFRGLLLGLFFLAVGMSLDLSAVAADWRLILLTVLAYTALKSLGIYAVARLFRASHPEALERTVLMAQGGEFAFVLYAAALGVGLIDARGSAALTAVIVLSMVLTPLLLAAHDRWLRRPPQPDDGDAEAPDGLQGSVLLIGFGRFGQIAAQVLLSRGWSVSIIDTDTQMIAVAGYMGMKVHYGDGARLDILQAAGAAEARAVLICIDRPETATRIAQVMKAEYPLVPVLARAFDRAHALALVRAGVDFQLRETFESALSLGARALDDLGESPEVVEQVLEEVRKRDADRFAAQMTGDLTSGRDLLLSNLPDHLRDAARAAAPDRLAQAMQDTGRS